MKKILWLCPLMLLMMAFIGCDDKEKDDDESLGGQLSETTWAAEVKSIRFSPISRSTTVNWKTTATTIPMEYYNIS